ncbi:MAG: hypothetical protein E5X53_12405 [Mesorhizobium sp.]|uniref:hypothetical protein n=1 Tax=Mesorhizobium sp. TaxID=1871066 RepID=UPI00121BF219|nr:hypothetical protein [Mesorhizobium sp.]TIP74836.1 MAG: hypothetical protein E5X55_07775 [Mesorhizobium sp.]TIQ14651.1 MAG: hypothetical protein E5X57_04140 [Mesorhizobium sp.]TIR52165.1 MAG: hypothetical protein E5X53_12405 [Mesorhizobium sp.]TJV96279.1 MAG: hypothetical protein E5X52_19715 [Mesorhizobium sp.]
MFDLSAIISVNRDRVSPAARIFASTSALVCDHTALKTILGPTARIVLIVMFELTTIGKDGAMPTCIFLAKAQTSVFVYFETQASSADATLGQARVAATRKNPIGNLSTRFLARHSAP